MFKPKELKRLATRTLLLLLLLALCVILEWRQYHLALSLSDRKRGSRPRN